MNDFEDEDKDHVKVNFKIINGELPFLVPNSEREDRFDNGVGVDLVSKIKVI